MGRKAALMLGESGHEITLLNRGNHQVDWPFRVRELQGDRTAPDDMRQLKSYDFDIVLDFAGYTEADIKGLLEVVSADTHIVFISSGAVYKPIPELPWVEEGPYGPWPLWGEYGRGKLQAEQVLANRHTERAFSIILRIPYVLGPYNYADREEFVLNRLIDEEPIAIPGDGQAVIQFISVTQVAQSIHMLVERLAAGNRPFGINAAGTEAFNLASRNCLATLEGFVQVCADVVGRNANLRYVPTERDTGFNSPLRPDSLIFPFPNASYILDIERADRAGILPERMSLKKMIQEAHKALVADMERRVWSRTEGEYSAFMT